MSTSVFVNTDLACNKNNMRSHAGTLIFYNKTSNHWYGKRQPSVVSSTFGAELRAMKKSVKLTEDLKYKMFVTKKQCIKTRYY